MKSSIIAAGAALLVFASAGMAQTRTLQFDVNNLGFQAFNGQGQSSAFGGLAHSGRLDLFEESPITELLSVSIRTGSGPFIMQPFVGTLTNMAMSLTMTNGAVTGGSLILDVNGGPGPGDRYSATLSAAGAVSTYIGGGFKVEGLTISGSFSDANFGGVAVADFFASQGGPQNQGSFIGFKIQPDASGAGHADTDIFVTTVPSPGSMACLAAAGIVAIRRRRR